MQQVVVVSTGGTISMRPDPATGKLVPALTGAELVRLLGGDGPEPEVDEVAHVPSWDVHGELALEVARRAVAHAARGAGVVVTHGTDTMEETVWTVDRLLPPDGPPVVVTGAQRGADEPDADGPRNLRDALLAAGSPDARGRGAMICFAGELHAAREARKVHASAVHGFGSPGYGPIGHVDGDRVVFQRRPDRRPPLPAPEGRCRASTSCASTPGADDVLLRASLAAGARAIVLECTGRGNASEALLPAVREAVAAGVTVVACTRCAEGRVEPVYGRGGGRDLAEAGVVFAGDLAGPKARVLLQLALAAGVDHVEAVEAEAG